MDKRKPPYTISRPQLLQPPLPVGQKPSPPPPPPPPPPPAAPTSNTGPRPLSDIRELSEPSLTDSAARRRTECWAERNSSNAYATSVRRVESLKKVGAGKYAHATTVAELPPVPLLPGDASSSYSSTPEQSSFYTVPYSSVPRRSSSQTHPQRPTKAHARKPSIRVVEPTVGISLEGFIIPNHGQSHSPVKQVAQGLDAVQSDGARRIPSRTYIRAPPPADILEFPSYRHPRVKLELQVSAPLFVGGGSIEGSVKITVDEHDRMRARRTLAIGAISLDLIGFEDMSGSRRATFLAIGTDLIDVSHPPPANMIEPPNPLATEDERFWTLAPSTSTLPFIISLPLDTGPPPFQSKHASIRFLLAVTALINDAGKHYRVRTSQDVSVLATYDPEKALSSLSSPLTATDEVLFPRFGRCETLRITAGLHRQVWVSGSSIFVDVHIANRTHKAVKRMEMNLERDILCYKHAPAGTSQKSASQARIFESNEQTMITRSCLKAGQQGWNGVDAHSSHTRTCELELPRGHATVRCGKYLEVRYFLNVTASLSNTKLVSVQLPIILIHMNSLDVLPNSVAQVAAAIEEKWAQGEHRRMRSKQHEALHTRERSTSSPAAMAELRRRPSYSQGRAFAAPRLQSRDRKWAVQDDIEDLRRVIDSASRKFGSPMCGAAIKKVGSSVSIGAVNLGVRTGDAVPGGIAERYRTPPASAHQAGRAQDSDLRVNRMGSRDALFRIQSLDSLYKKRGKGDAKRSGDAVDQNSKPRYHFTVVQDRMDPHTLGLTSASRQPSSSSGKAGDSISRPATGLGFREKLDWKRFEFRGIRTRGSGNLRERSGNWREQPKWRDREYEGWI